MDIRYNQTKEAGIYGRFVENPDDRKTIRDFCKKYSRDLMKPALDLHELMRSSVSAAGYNKVCGKNKIEVLQGSKGNAPQRFKVRVTLSYRKVFFQVIENTDDFLKTIDWKGAFDEMKSICVVAVNNHKYNEV